jgi:hypothetical protein
MKNKSRFYEQFPVSNLLGNIITSLVGGNHMAQKDRAGSYGSVEAPETPMPTADDIESSQV